MLGSRTGLLGVTREQSHAFLFHSPAAASHLMVKARGNDAQGREEGEYLQGVITLQSPAGEAGPVLKERRQTCKVAFCPESQ